MELRQAENGVYYVHWTEGRRSKRISTRSKTLAAAKVFFATWLTHEAAGPGVQRPAATTADIYAVYYREHVLRKVISVISIEKVWKNLLQGFGHLRPAEVTQETFDDYERDRKAGIIGRPSGSSTVWHELTMLYAAWNFAAKRKPKAEGEAKLVSKDDIPDLDIPDAPTARDRWLRLPEIETLMNEAAKRRTGKRLTRAERFLWLALETASRRHVIEILKWPQVDFETRVIHYASPSRRKSTKRAVSVPISDRLLPILERAFEERVSEFVLDHGGDAYGAVCRVAVAAGLPDVTPHVLRHTAGTHMARNGVPLWEIAGVLGNSLKMIEEVYAHHSPDALVGAVNAIRPTRREDRLRVVK